jgi:AsmA protein
MPGNDERGFGVFRILALLVVLLIAAVIALPFLIDANQFRPKLESEISVALKREVKVGDLKLSILSGGIAADDISISDDPAFSESAFVRAKALQVGVQMKPLIFSRQVRVTRISLEQPEITLIRSDSGDWNFSSIGGSNHPGDGGKQAGGAGAPGDITIETLNVSNGRIQVIRGTGNRKPRVYEKVELQARDISFSTVIPFSISAALPGGGNAKIEGKAGPMDRSDLSLTPFSATLVFTRLDLIASGFIDSSAGLAGIIDFNGSLNSDGKDVASKGMAKAEKLQIVKGGSPAGQTVSLDYSVAHNLKSQAGTLKEAKVGFGKAIARLEGKYSIHGDTTALRLRLRGENVPAQDLEALLPAIGVTLPKGATLKGGTLNADLNAEGPVEKLVITGPVGISNTRLEGFDLAGKVATVASLAGIKPSTITEIEKFASDLQVMPDGIQARNLVLILPAVGQLTGDGTVGPNSSLDFKMLAKVNPSTGVMGSLTRMAGIKTGNEVAVPFFIRGTTSNPSFVPDTRGIAKGLLESALSGKNTKSGDGTQGQSLSDTLRGLFNKKKKP